MIAHFSRRKSGEPFLPLFFWAEQNRLAYRETYASKALRLKYGMGIARARLVSELLGLEARHD